MTLTFGRQQLSELTAIDDDVLGYWIREGLLRPLAGGDGKGKHRRFDYRQVNIAALLGEMRGIGVNISGLRSFAAIMQRGVEIADSGPWTVGELEFVLELRHRVDAFSAGEPLKVLDRATNDFVLPKTIEEVVDYTFQNEQNEKRANAKDFCSLRDLAMRLNDYDCVSCRSYTELHYAENLKERGLGGISDEWDELMWLVSPEPEGGWYIGQPNFVDVKKRPIRSAITLGVSLIVRRIWVAEPVKVAR